MLYLCSLLVACFTAADMTGDILFRIPEPGLIPEGIAYDPASGDFFLGSIREGRIISIAPDGSYRDFVTSRRDGLMSVLGMKVDSRGRLWACTNAGNSLTVGVKPEEKAGVMVFDLSDGHFVGSAFVDKLNDNHLFNDVTFDANGNAYITGFNCPYIYRVDGETFVIEEWFTMPEGVWTNGIDFAADHSVLFISGNNDIYRLEMATKKLNILQPPPGETLGHADGLYFHNGSLIAVQHREIDKKLNVRIARSYLNADMTAVERIEVIAEDLPGFRIPTTGTIAAGKFCLLATSYLDALAKDGSFDPAKSGEVVIMGFPLR